MPDPEAADGFKGSLADGQKPGRDPSVQYQYQGFAGAAVYSALILAVTFIVALAASLVLGGLADSGEVAATIFLRILVFGGATAAAAGLSRWIAGGRTDRLLSLKIVQGDYGGIAGLLAGLLIAGFQTTAPANSDSSVPRISVGDPLEIQGPVLTGGSWNLADHRGKVVLIDFWATWCPPCIEELPFVRRAFDQYQGRGFEVVAVSLDRSRAVLEAFLEEHAEPWPQIFFEPSRDNPLTEQYQVESIPFLVLVDREGKVSAVDIRGNQIDRAVSAALEGRPYTPNRLGRGGILGVVSMIVDAVLWSPWWLLASAICVCSTIGAALEAVVRRGKSTAASGAQG